MINILEHGLRPDTGKLRSKSSKKSKPRVSFLSHGICIGRGTEYYILSVRLVKDVLSVELFRVGKDNTPKVGRRRI